jgi:S-adenosyl methyltransferase
VATRRDPVSQFDASRPHVARVYDYLLGGKDNISQVVPAPPYSDPTVIGQACHAHYSKITSFAVRYLSYPCLGSNVRFVGQGFLTLA